MVRVGEYELRLVRPGGAAFPEVQHIDGKVFTVAEPGAVFEVQLTRHPSPFRPAKPDGTFHSASLHVDGQGVGYNKIISTPGTCTYVGFLKAGDARSIAYESFVFTKPAETEAKQVTGLNFQEGSISCEVSLAQFTGGDVEDRRSFGPEATNESIAKLPEGKKFFMAPSLTTGKGEVKSGAGFDRRAWQLVGPRGSVASLALRYETASTLLLRCVLKRDNPAHSAILQQFPETAQQQEQDGAGPSRRAPAVKAERGAAAVKAEHGRKRQRQAPRAAAEEEEEELIDLTNVPNEADEVLAAKRAHKVLECDLTGDDELAPAWKVKQEEAHTVT